MLSIRVSYILLHLFEILLFYISGRKMSHSISTSSYWRSSIWAFCAYFIVMGMRFGHNLDWNYYYLVYSYSEPLDLNTTEPLFNLFFYSCLKLGIPYYLTIAIKDTFFLFSFLLIAKHFKTGLCCTLPLILVVAQMNDNYIRWYFAVSFLLLSLNSLLNEAKMHRLLAIIFFVCACLIHNGALFFLVFLPFLKRNKLLFDTKISAILIFISVFFISIGVMEFVSRFGQVLFLLGGDSVSGARVGHYLTQVDQITTKGWGSTGIMTYTIWKKIMTYCSYLPVILYAPLIMGRFKNGIIAYNVFLLGAFLNPFFSTVEIFDRYSMVLLFFHAIVGGPVYYLILKKSNNLIIKFLCVLSLLSTFYPFYKYVFNTYAEYRMLYIWDAKNREYIDPDVYLIDMSKH